MIDFFCNIYSSIKDNNAILKKMCFYSVLRALTRLCANILLPIYIRCTSHHKNYSLISSTNRDVPVIVSLTSFPARINRLWLVIETILRQTIKPDKIILWLSKEQFDNFHSLPTNLLNLQSRGLEIRFVEGDIRSHKKYLYSISEYPHANIITIDDDIFYNSHTIQYLLDSHKQYPSDVIANITHQLQYDSAGELLLYSNWKHNISIQNCSSHIFQVGVGGVLYPPRCAHKDICDMKLAYTYCPYGDDIWLFAMCRLKGTTIRTSMHTFTPLPIYNIHNISLSTSNLQGRNDTQIQQLRQYCIQQYNSDPFEL